MIVIVLITLALFFFSFQKVGYYGIANMVDDASSSIDNFIALNQNIFANYTKNTLILADCSNVNCDKIPASNCQINNCMGLRENDRIIHISSSVCPIYHFFTDSRLFGMTEDSCNIDPVYGQITIMPIRSNKEFEFKSSSEYFALLHYDGLYDVDSYAAQMGSFYYENNADANISYNDALKYLETYWNMDGVVLLDFDSYNYKDGMIATSFVTNYLYRNNNASLIYHFMIYLDKNKVFMYREFSPFFHPRYQIDDTLDYSVLDNAAQRVQSFFLENYANDNHGTNLSMLKSSNFESCPFNYFKSIFLKDASYLCDANEYYGVGISEINHKYSSIDILMGSDDYYNIVFTGVYSSQNETSLALSSIKDYLMSLDMHVSSFEDNISYISINSPDKYMNEFNMISHYYNVDNTTGYYIHSLLGIFDNNLFVSIEKSDEQSRKYHLGKTSRSNEDLFDFVHGKMRQIELNRIR